MKLPFWVIFLALYLLLVAILRLTNIQVVATQIIEGVLALLASVCLFFQK